MAWTTKPNGIITLKGTGLAASLTKAWLIDDVSGDNWNEEIADTDDINFGASAVTWASNPYTATIGADNQTDTISLSHAAGTIILVFTPENWSHSSADIYPMWDTADAKVLRIQYLHFGGTKRWYVVYRQTQTTSEEIHSTQTDYTSDAQLNTHTVIAFTWEENVTPTTDVGTAIWVEQKDQAVSLGPVRGTLNTFNASALDFVPNVRNDDLQSGSEQTKYEGIFFWNARLTDAEIETLIADVWGELADTGGGGSVAPLAGRHLQNMMSS